MSKFSVPGYLSGGEQVRDPPSFQQIIICPIEHTTFKGQFLSYNLSISLSTVFSCVSVVAILLVI